MTDPSFIPTQEAFRIILQAIYPDDLQLGDTIDREFFHEAQKKYKFFPPSSHDGWSTYRYSGAEPPPDHAWKPFEAVRILTHAVLTQKIRLQGSLNGAPPASINEADCVAGNLDTLAGTLAIGKDYTYRRVWCSRADVVALVAPAEAQFHHESAPAIPATQDQPQRPQRPRRRLPKRQAFDDAITALYPEGLPDTAPQLTGAIQGWLKSNRPAIKITDRHIERLVRQLR